MAILVQSNKKPSVSFPSQTGNLVTFNSQYAGLPLKSCVVNIPVTQEGTGDPSPDNVRNFVGVDSLDFSATDKNIFDGYAFANLIYQNGTAASIDTTNKTVTFTNAKSPFYQNLTPSMRFKENTQYTFIIPYLNNGVNNCIRVQYTDGSIAWIYLISSSGQKTNYVLVTDANKTISHLFFVFVSNARTTIWYDEVCCLEGIHTADDYIPYVGNNKLFTFGQTIYAGELDVLTGIFTATHGFIASYNGETIKEPWISSIDEYVEGTTPTNGAQVVYPLATPEVINLGGMEISTAQGENNLFASTGETTVQYIKIGG